MPKRSAGILLYRYEAGNLLVLLVHPGGPFWSNRDVGAWSIPKGEYDAAEERPGSQSAVLWSSLVKSARRVASSLRLTRMRVNST